MKRYCLYGHKVFIPVICPSCGCEFNLLGPSKFVQLDEDTEVLVCGNCEIDYEKIKGKMNEMECMGDVSSEEISLNTLDLVGIKKEKIAKIKKILQEDTEDDL